MPKNNYLIAFTLLGILGVNTPSLGEPPGLISIILEYNRQRLLEYGRQNMPRNMEHEIIWGYSEFNGPNHWGQLDPEFQLCSQGREQSPIDIRPTEVTFTDLPDIEFVYGPTPVDIFNNGRTIEISYTPGSFIVLGNTEYDLAQLHFHLRSEHTFAQGARFDMEMHLVHTNIDPNAETPVAVVTAFIREGEENQVLKQVWENLPTREGEEFFLPFSLNIENALPADRRTYRYKGSFTTPPCTQDVQWLLLKQPIEMSRQQIEKFRNILEHSCCLTNYRPTQPLNDREVFFDTTQE